MARNFSGTVELIKADSIMSFKTKREAKKYFTKLGPKSGYWIVIRGTVEKL